ncbi:hypothetical protein BHE74_00048602 [Ensete ventricosum]|nr:hypothetical protein BHE74_00048602 [Ensete ventricosum]
MEPSPATPEPVPSPKPTTKRSLLSSLMEVAAAATTATAALQRSSSFKEDSYLASSLRSSELKALQELKQLLSTSTKPISIWGVPVAPAGSGGDERADVVLLKFLRARDFDAGQAHAMLLQCAEWRREFGADGLADEELVGFKEMEGVVAYMHGWDRRGHPVCYNAYGVFKDKSMYDRILGDAEKLQRFLRWRVQVMERGVSLLQLRPGGINSIIQVTDLKDMPKRELRAASKHILSLFQDNYPEMVARKVSSWPIFLLVASILSTIITFPVIYACIKHAGVHQRPLVFQRAVRNDKFIRPEFVPVQYGGLSRPGDLQNGPPKPATEFTIKGGEKVNLEIDGIEVFSPNQTPWSHTICFIRKQHFWHSSLIHVLAAHEAIRCSIRARRSLWNSSLGGLAQAGATIAWDIAVGGWDLDYGAEYVPSDEGSYTVVVEKTRRIPAAADEPIHDVFNAREAGKMVLSIDNTSSRRRKAAAYRYFVRKASSM